MGGFFSILYVKFYSLFIINAVPELIAANVTVYENEGTAEVSVQLATAIEGELTLSYSTVELPNGADGT